MSTEIQSVPILDELAHCYALDGKRLHSVTRVIRDVWPKKNSFQEAIEDPSTPDWVIERIERSVEHARTRGKAVDYWICEYARTNGNIDIDDDPEVVERVEAFDRWWQASKPGYIDHQRIVWDSSLMICGQLDLLLNVDGKATIVDAKCTANEESSWPIQVGGYRSLYHRTPKPDQFLIEQIGVLQLNPKFKRGYIYRKYDPEKSSQWWNDTANFWKTFQQATA